MAAGGRRSGAGRKAGAKTKRTQEIAKQAVAQGISPLEYMLNILRDENQLPADRFEAAKHAAPYVHPRLASTEAKVNHSGAIDTSGIDAPKRAETPEEWNARRERELAAMVPAAGAAVARD